MPTLPLNLTGLRFGRLTAISLYSTGGIKRKWLCLCDCGKEHITTTGALRNGTTRSCGCYKSDCSRKMLTKHGNAVPGNHTPIYATWSGMKQRTSNSNHPDYRHYGGRGITVCERWSGNNGFQNFIDDMGQRPAKHSIDRINVNGNYEPNNCRWATQSEQVRNTRQNDLITIDGITKCRQDWSNDYGVPSNTIHRRISVLGWTPKDAVTIPLSENKNRTMTTNRNFEINGVTKCLKEWTEIYNVNYSAIHHRIHKGGWDVEKALATPVRYRAKSIPRPPDDAPLLPL